jgi:hypothetical protein
VGFFIPTPLQMKNHGVQWRCIQIPKSRKKEVQDDLVCDLPVVRFIVGSFLLEKNKVMSTFKDKECWHNFTGEFISVVAVCYCLCVLPIQWQRSFVREKIQMN